MLTYPDWECTVHVHISLNIRLYRSALKSPTNDVHVHICVHVQYMLVVLMFSYYAHIVDAFTHIHVEYYSYAYSAPYMYTSTYVITFTCSHSLTIYLDGHWNTHIPPPPPFLSFRQYRLADFFTKSSA